MPKINSLGPKYFTQYIDFPVKWGLKVFAMGWTQEIDEPFRTTDKALIVRLPFHKAFVIGKWTGQLDEKRALEKATQGRVLQNEDFQEGWTAPAYKTREEDSIDWYV